MSRASVLGTIAVERASDAGLLGLAVAVGVLVGFRQLAPTVGFLLLATAIAVAVAAAAFLVLRRDRVVATRIGGYLHHHGARFWAGASGLRSWRDRAAWAALTVTSYVLTVLIFTTVASAVGLSLPVWQAALAMAAVTLSTAIPAGPASIGTYEFVGMTVLVSVGLPAEQSLLCVALVHAVVVVPPSLIGLVAMWWLNVRPQTPRVSTRARVAERAG